AAFNGARIVGPAVAGLLIARFGLAPAFLLNGLSFLVVLGALLLVRADGAPRPRAGTTMGEEVLEGLRYALGTPRIALMLSLVLVVSLFVFNFTVFVPLLTTDAAPRDLRRGRPVLCRPPGALGHRPVPRGGPPPLPHRLLLDRLHRQLQHDPPAHDARRAARPRDEPPHADVRRRLPARRLHDRRAGRGLRRADGAPRGRRRGPGRHGRDRPLVARAARLCVQQDLSVGSSPTLTTSLPKFRPRRRPRKAWGACSSPTTTSSRYVSFPARYHWLMSRRKSARRSMWSETMKPLMSARFIRIGARFGPGGSSSALYC